MTRSTNHVAIIGAGPYGLAAAAHLREANLETTVFGRAMDFWKNHMPAGMLLRSPWNASHISDPRGDLTLNKYLQMLPSEPAEPVSLATFVDYGAWFQSRIAPDLDQRQVVRIEKENGQFRLSLEDGETFRCGRVVIATGIASFAHRPDTFDRVPPTLVSHSAEHRDFTRFAGQEIVVVGCGQSALESAALLSEIGANIELIARRPDVRWLHAREILRHRWNPLRNLIFHPTDVGPALLTQVTARPEWFQRIPSSLQQAFAYRCIRPAGAAWLRPRMGQVTITTGRVITSAKTSAERLRLTIDDGSSRIVDHVLLATGYRVDVLRHKFLAPELAAAIRCKTGYPELGKGFESSVPGLHFVGAPAAFSYGPLMRFVSGTAYSGRELTRCVVGNAMSHTDARRRPWEMSHMQER